MLQSSVCLSYRRCPVHPDDRALLITGHFPIDVNTLLKIYKHGYQGHEGEEGVQQDAKLVQLWKERQTNELFCLLCLI